MKQLRLLSFITVTLIILAGYRAGLADEKTTGQAKPEDGTAILATVNGEEVHLEDVEQRLVSLHREAPDSARENFDVDGLMFQVVNDILLGQEARALEMDQEEAIRDKVLEFQEKAVLRMLESREIKEKSRPTEEEVKKVYEQQYARVNLQVVTAYDQEGAEALKTEIAAGADMETVARERSVDPYALRGGHVKTIAKIDLTREIADLAFTLEPGKLAGPVRTDLGWSVFRVESFLPADPEGFDNLESKCRDLARFYKAQQLRLELAERLRQQHQVKINRELADKVVPEALPDGRLMPKVDDPEAVIAIVGDRSIKASQLAKALVARWKGVRNQEAAEAAAPIVLNRLVERELLLAEAFRREYAELPEVRRAVRAYENQLLVEHYLREVVAAGVEVSPEEMKAFYVENREQYHRPPSLRLGQITVKTMEEAEHIVEQLEKGTDPAWLARRHSIDAYKDKGGDRGWYTPQPGLDPFNDSLFNAAVGEVLEPYGLPGNYIVTKVLAREERGIYEFDEISGNIRNAVLARKIKTVITEFMEKLRSRAEIEINQEALAQLDVSGERDTEAAGGMHGH